MRNDVKFWKKLELSEQRCTIKRIFTQRGAASRTRDPNAIFKLEMKQR